MVEYSFGFTGTRRGMTEDQRAALVEFLSGSSGELHHGDCRGADSEAHDVADACGYAVVLHPPKDFRLRAFREVPAHMMRPERPYMVRNRAIVDDTVALIAAPADAVEQARGGTWSTVRYARKLGRTVILLLPDGSVEQSDNRRFG